MKRIATLTGIVEKFWMDAEGKPTNLVNVSIELPDSIYQKYIPEIDFFQKEGRMGRYWGDCSLDWLTSQFDQELQSKQKLKIAIMSDESLKFYPILLKRYN